MFEMPVRKLILLCSAAAALAVTSCHHQGKKQAASSAADTAAAAPVVNEKAEIQEWFQNPALLSWSRKMKRKDSAFSAGGFFSSGTDSVGTQPALPYSVREWQTFSGYFVYAPGRDLAIDMYSYGSMPPKKEGDTTMEGGEPDSEISLVDVRARTKRRLLFAGPGTVFEKAAWLGDSLIIITGESDANSANLMRPVLWKIDLADSSVSIYEYKPDQSRDPGRPH
jgi:hypothetical protein